MKNKIFIIAPLILCGALFLCKLELVKTNNRQETIIHIPQYIVEDVVQAAQGLNDDEIAIVNYCVKYTAQLLEFSFKEDSSFNNLPRKAHCVTYAKVCSTLCNIAFAKTNSSAVAKPVVGYVEFGGININKILTWLFPKSKNNVKDHDFVEISSPDYTLYVDPCCYDLIKLDLKQ